MVLKRAVWIAVASLALIGARESQAQPITVTNNGQPMAGAQISAMINGIKQPLGTTNAGGQVTTDTSMLDVPAGTEVTVWIQACEDGTVQVILVPAGEEGECTEEGAQAGERCGCRRAGIVIWGDGPVTIDVGRGTVTQTSPGRATNGADHDFADVQFGPIIGYTSFYQFEDVACDQAGIVSCEGDAGAVNYGAYLDYQFGDSPLGLSLEAHYSKLEVTQEYQTSTNFAEVNAWYVQATAVYSRSLSPSVGWYGRLGYSLAYNDGDFETSSSSGIQQEGRSETGSRLVTGTGLHFPIGENWCTRVGVDWTTGFESNDADTNVRTTFAVGYRMNFGGAR